MAYQMVGPGSLAYSKCTTDNTYCVVCAGGSKCGDFVWGCYLICDGMLRDLKPGIWDLTGAVDVSDAAVLCFRYSALSPHSDLVIEIVRTGVLGKTTFYNGLLVFVVYCLPAIPLYSPCHRLHVRLIMSLAPGTTEYENTGIVRRGALKDTSALHQ